MEYENSTWILDYRATNHICFSFQENNSRKGLLKGEITLQVGTGEMVSTDVVGDLKLYFEDKYIIVKNVLYVAQMRRNLIFLLYFGTNV